MSRLRDAAAAAHGRRPACASPSARRHAGGERGLRHEGQRAARAARRRSRRTSAGMSTGCGVGMRGVGVAHLRRSAMKPPLSTSSGLTPKKAGFHSTRSASLPASTRADLVRDAVRDRRVDRVLGDVALDARVVVARRCRRAARRAAPSSCARSARCAVMTSPTRPIACESDEIMLMAPRSCRMSSAAIVSRADAALGEGHVLGDAGVQVVADHQHVEVLVERVDGERPRRVGATTAARSARRTTRMMSGAWPPPAPSVW